MKAVRESPLGLDMPFAEALARFIGTAAADPPDAVQKKRRPKPPPEVADEKDPKAPT